MKRVQSIVAAAMLTLGASTFAGPVTVDFNSTESLKGLGSFGGTAVYDDTTDQLTLDITNTSKGSLTAFAFDVMPGDSAKFDRAKGSHWKDERNHKGVINAKPFGKFQGGAGINGTWGSTAVKKGIAAGQSETFVFNVTGSNASTLTTTDFFDSTRPEIAATFAGFKHHKTDRASGFGSAVVPTSITQPGTLGSPTSGGGSLILNVKPPVVTLTPIGGTTIPISNGGGSGTSAVPLPPAAPVGMAMLAIFGLVRVIWRGRRMFA